MRRVECVLQGGREGGAKGDLVPFGAVLLGRLCFDADVQSCIDAERAISGGGGSV